VTIREHFELVYRRTKYTVLAVAAVPIVTAVMYLHVATVPLLAVVVITGLGIGFALRLITGWLFRCPRCCTDFEEERIKLLGRGSRDRRMYWVLWDACPRCGISFNDPWP